MAYLNAIAAERHMEIIKNQEFHRDQTQKWNQNKNFYYKNSHMEIKKKKKKFLANLNTNTSKRKNEKKKKLYQVVAVERRWKHKPLSRHWQRYGGATYHGDSGSTVSLSLCQTCFSSLFFLLGFGPLGDFKFVFKSHVSLMCLFC